MQQVPAGRRMMGNVPMLVIDATLRTKPELEWGPGVAVGAAPSGEYEPGHAVPIGRPLAGAGPPITT